MGYWKTVSVRAFREALAEVRLDTPVRIVTGAITPIIAALVVWWATGNAPLAGVVGVGLLVLVGLTVFIVKLFTVPPQMAAEATARIHTLREQKVSREAAQQRRLIDQLTQEYMMSFDNLSPAFMAGLKLPPAEWLNERLGELGEDWFIGEVHPNGRDFTVMRILPKKL